MLLLVLAHPGCPGQNPKSRKTVVCVCVMSMYTSAKTDVRTVYDNSNGSEVKVGMHQGSALSPLLFVMVMEALSREYRVAVPWELLYTDGLVVIAQIE